MQRPQSPLGFRRGRREAIEDGKAGELVAAVAPARGERSS
jgi:hypothetical protein